MSNDTLKNLDAEAQEKLMASLKVKGISTNVVMVDEVVDPHGVAIENAPISHSDMMDLLMSKGTKKQQSYLKDTKVKTEVADLMKVCESLYTGYEKYKDLYVTRGNQALYGVLGDVYATGLNLQKSPHQEFVVGQMKELLKAQDINVSSKASAMSVLLRFVIRVDKLEASRYGKVLMAALDANVQPENFVQFVKDNGGVSGLYLSTAQAAERKALADSQLARVEYVRHLHQLLEIESTHEFDYDGPIAMHRQDKTSATQNSSFYHFICVESGANKYKVITGHEFDKDFENQILKQLATNLPTDQETIEESIRAYARMLLKSTDLYPGDKVLLEKKLTNPLYTPVDNKSSKKGAGKTKVANPKDDVVDV